MITIHSLEDARLPLRDTAVALGMFDGVHTGHQAVLRSVADHAASHGLTPCVFTFALADPPRAKAGAAQLTTPAMMAEIMAELGMEYAVAPSFEALRDRTGEEYVRDFLHDTLGARHVSCGFNFGFGQKRGWNALDLQAICKNLDMTCTVVPPVTDGDGQVSSTRIRSCILEGDIPTANRLLGRQFAIDFEVVQGNRIGRTLGTPTINQPFPKGFIVPRFGVYATLAQVGGRVYSGVTNVGIKPTVGSDIPLAETYIQGYSGDLYGEKIRVRFLQFIRPERKFASLDELRANILQNAQSAAEIAAGYLEQTRA